MIEISKINWKRLLLLSLTFVIIFISLRVFIFNLTPFMFGLVLAVLIDKPVNFMSRKLPRGLSVLFMIILVLSIFILLLFFIVVSSINELIYLSRYLPEYRLKIMEIFDKGIITLEDFFERMPTAITGLLEKNLNLLYSRGENIISGFVDKAVNFTFNIPGIIILILFTIIFAFFLSKDKDKILNFIGSRTQIFQQNRSEVFNDILSYIKVQLLIMSNTTVLTMISFSFLRYPYAIILALLCGVLDLIPIIGPGIILWPLMIYNLLINLSHAVLFFLVYLVIDSARPVLQSRILGRSIGVHPDLMLLGIYIRMTMFGFMDVVLARVSIIVFKAIPALGIDI